MPRRTSKRPAQSKHRARKSNKLATAGETADIPCPLRNILDDFPTGAPPLPDKRRVKLALAVSDLIRQYKALERFQDMIRRWVSIRKQWLTKVKDFEMRRDEHHERVFEDSRLRDEQAGPPGDGWLFEGLRWDDRVSGVLGGWVPAELSSSKWPDAPFPLPVPDREALPEEKYAALAAIHDHELRGVTKIDPWKAEPADSREGGAYRWGLLRIVPYLTKDDEKPLHSWLKDVKEDLQLDAKPPLSSRAALVYEKLVSLPTHRAMKLPEILDWLADQGENIDESTFTSRIVPELRPYGLLNKPKIGYYIRKP